MRLPHASLSLALVLYLCAPVMAQEFLRGDVDGNGHVDPVADSLFLLDWAFNEGPEPPCEDAADSDGNNVLFAIVDSLFLLKWGFEDDDDPPAPGVETCGADDGVLGCATEPADCPTDPEVLEEDSDYLLSIGSATVDDDTEESASLIVALENDGADVRALQFGICHDPEVVCVADGGVTESSAVEDLEPTFSHITIVDGAWGAAVLFEVVAQAAIESGETPDLFDVTYTIMGEGTSDLLFCDHPGEQSWPIRVFTVDGPEFPSVEDGSIEVNAFDGTAECELPPDSGGGNGGGGGGSGDCIVDDGEGDYTFIVGDATGFVGGDVEVPVDLLIEGSCVVAFQLGLCFDHDDLTYESGESGEGLESVSLTFFGTGNEVDGNMTIGCLLDVITQEVLEESVDSYEIAVATFSIESDFGSTEISSCAPEFAFGPGVIGVVQQGGGLDEDLEYDDGTVFTTTAVVSIAPAVTFERGDVNGDGTVFAIVDAIDLLEWFFTEGDEPPCLDAADVDDNGTVAGLVDGVYLLTYGFLSGDEPLPPFGECDIDPTDDSVSCESSSDVCE